MTISGHHEAMRPVKIAELKARLSQYLRAVRRGETVTVLDRETPIARIIPVSEGLGLRVRAPAAGARKPNKVQLLEPARLDLDIVDLLLEERQGSR
jgi:prevent-host-death family protein